MQQRFSSRSRKESLNLGERSGEVEQFKKQTRIAEKRHTQPYFAHEMMGSSHHGILHGIVITLCLVPVIGFQDNTVDHRSDGRILKYGDISRYQVRAGLEDQQIAMPEPGQHTLSPDGKQGYTHGK